MQHHYHGEYSESDRKTKSAKKCAICGIVTGATLVCTYIFLIMSGYAIGFGLALGLSKTNATDILPTAAAPVTV